MLDFEKNLVRITEMEEFALKCILKRNKILNEICTFIYLLLSGSKNENH